MENLNFDSYFESTDNQYYDSKFIITILENILGTNFDDIKKTVNGAQVVVTKEQITKFLEKTWKLVHGISGGRYYFEPYTLEYFNKYSNIVRNKVLLLLNVVEKIGNRDTMSIQDLITELDIQLDESGNISRDDIIRLIIPTVYNIGVLNEKVSKANDLSTYFTFKMSKHSLYKDGCTEEEIYPSSSLQIKNLYYDHIRGNVPLSSTQRTELEQEQRRSMKKIAKILIDL